MRIAIMAAALGLVLGVPGVAPESMVPAAQAQSQAQIDALAAEILAAPDQATRDAIIARETAAGNFSALAQGLAAAATTLAQTDLGGAAALIASAVTVAESGGDDAQIQVGVAASTVATTAEQNNDTAAVQVVETAVQNSTDPDVNTAYVITGGNSGDSVPYSGPTTPTTPTTTTGDTTTPTGDDTPTTTGDDTTTPTPDTGNIIAPRPPTTPAVPVPTIPEPNPVQTVDPVDVVAPPPVDASGSPT